MGLSDAFLAMMWNESETPKKVRVRVLAPGGVMLPGIVHTSLICA